MNAQNAAQSAIVERLSFAYIESTLEPGVTIAEFRRARPKQPGRLGRLADRVSLPRRRQLAAA